MSAKGVVTAEQRVRFSAGPKFPHVAFNYHGYPFYWGVFRTWADYHSDKLVVRLLAVGGDSVVPYDECRRLEECRDVPIPELTPEQKDALHRVLAAFQVGEDVAEGKRIWLSFAVKAWERAAEEMCRQLEGQFVQDCGRWVDNGRDCEE